MPPAAALWIALESLATFRATFFLCRTPFEPAREMAEDAIERTFAAFAMPESAGKTPHIDPAAYARFLEAAKHFAFL